MSVIESEHESVQESSRTATVRLYCKNHSRNKQNNVSSSYQNTNPKNDSQFNRNSEESLGLGDLSSS